ncbi:TPA: hypothetical protein RTH03_001540 [Campylobacter jejuni]|nr:hypothetical protein [Campylobacter jejuni]HDZ5083601.1 hypothetical protein [Campylobacter jejuni]HDZ5086210.1 hypothetical protein [Campylobacter jejuni]HDZ5086740.1 hypothetical protein [Campylobacter jejuni]HDZ5090169.1 hypothetical protein [Campylobacter jejuni]
MKIITDRFNGEKNMNKVMILMIKYTKNLTLSFAFYQKNKSITLNFLETKIIPFEKCLGCCEFHTFYPAKIYKMSS